MTTTQLFCSHPQLFDVDNPVNKHSSKFLFSTEGHIFPLKKEFHHRPWQELFEDPIPSKKGSFQRKHKLASFQDREVDEETTSITADDGETEDSFPIITDVQSNSSMVSGIVSFYCGEKE